MITMEFTAEELGLIIYGVSLAGLENATLGLRAKGDALAEIENKDKVLVEVYERMFAELVAAEV